MLNFQGGRPVIFCDFWKNKSFRIWIWQFWKYIFWMFTSKQRKPSQSLVLQSYIGNFSVSMWYQFMLPCYPKNQLGPSNKRFSTCNFRAAIAGSQEIARRWRFLDSLGYNDCRYRGHFIIWPIQTMHYHNENPSKSPHVWIVWSPQMGSHFMSPLYVNLSCLHYL